MSVGDDTGTSNVFVLDQLRRALDKSGEGNGVGNGGGLGNGGGDGEDPRFERLRGVPIDARDLLIACKQLSDFTAKLIEMTVDRETALIERLMLAVEKSEAKTLQQVLELLKAEADARRSLTPILARRFEAIEHNVTMMGKHLGATYEGDEKGAGEGARNTS
jgi:hypothetical protein